jgi:uncharacterized membrane protein
MRGVIMVLMAIDHVRVYAGVPAGGPTPGVFFTRWVTHFVAPGFAFLAGTAAYFHGRKLGNRGALARYLMTRGAILVFLEITVIRVAWTFNLDFAHYNLAGVIWMLGWCMILMAALIYLPVATIGVIGLVLIFVQTLIGAIAGALPKSLAWLGQLLYFGGDFQIGRDGPPLVVLYVIVPWIGVMAAGYAFGAIMAREPAERRRLCYVIGCSAIALFLMLRGLDIGDPNRWRGGDAGSAPVLLRFLNTSKYPASPDFLLMTLGPLIALLPFAERARGRIGEWLATFGRVPMFYYLLHIPAIHIAAVVVSLIREGRVNPWLFGNHPMWPPELPDGYRWSLPLLYLVFALVVALLYLPCRWYAREKARRPLSWLRYI